MNTSAIAVPTIKIAPPVASLIGAYVLRGAGIPRLEFASVAKVGQLTSECGTLQHGSLTAIEFGESVLKLEDVYLPLGKLANDHAGIDLADGSSVWAKWAFVARRNSSASVNGSSTRLTEIELNEWHWTTNEMPIAWVGILHGVRFKSRNVLVRDAESDCLDSLRLQGNATWYLACKGAFGERTCLALITTTERSLREVCLESDFSALEFLIGGPLRLDLLVGVNERNEPVAAFGAGYGYRFRQQTLPKPPIPWDAQNAWLAVAFPKVVKALTDNGPNPIRIAVCGYVDSTIGHLDGQYLFAQVALEALAYRLAEEKKPIVNDVRDWEKWAKSVHDHLRVHAVDPQAFNTLAVKLKQLSRPTTSRLVEQVLRKMAIEPPTEGLDEIERRNDVVHTMSMTGGESYDIERESRRIRIIRTLLAAVILRHLGYEGALASWDLDESRWTEPAEWFCISDRAREESKTIYEADVT
jgi:hypothetical protein